MKKIIYFLPLLLVFALATAAPSTSCALQERVHAQAGPQHIPEAEDVYPAETGRSPFVMFKF